MGKPRVGVALMSYTQGKIHNSTELKLAHEDFCNQAALVVNNIPILCQIIKILIADFRKGKKVKENISIKLEDFVARVEYLLHGIEQDIDILQNKMIIAGYKELLYNRD